MTSTAELRAALVAAFPPTPFTRALLEEPTSRWGNDQHAEALVSALEGRTWRELDQGVIEAHPAALVSAGTETFRALVPAYLAYLLDQAAFNEVPFLVAGELTRTTDPVDQRIFDARVAVFEPAQRTTVVRVLEQLTTRAPMESVMTVALATWRTL